MPQNPFVIATKTIVSFVIEIVLAFCVSEVAVLTEICSLCHELRLSCMEMTLAS